MCNSLQGDFHIGEHDTVLYNTSSVLNSKCLLMLSNNNRGHWNYLTQSSTDLHNKEKQILVLLCGKFRALLTQNQGNFNKDRFIFSDLCR